MLHLAAVPPLVSGCPSLPPTPAALLPAVRRPLAAVPAMPLPRRDDQLRPPRDRMLEQDEPIPLHRPAVVVGEGFGRAQQQRRETPRRAAGTHAGVERR